jgi:hypothetical protein
MADTITLRTDAETEHALAVLTHDGSSRSAVIRQAVLEAALRRERAAELRRAALRMPIGEPDGVDVGAELTRERDGER